MTRTACAAGEQRHQNQSRKSEPHDCSCHPAGSRERPPILRHSRTGSCDATATDSTYQLAGDGRRVGALPRLDEGASEQASQPYRVTAAGKAAFRDWLAGLASGEPREEQLRSPLLLTVFFGEFLRPEILHHVLVLKLDERG
jgi:hypothetical protein